MIAAKAYLIGPASRVSSNVTVTRWQWRRLSPSRSTASDSRATRDGVPTDCICSVISTYPVQPRLRITGSQDESFVIVPFGFVAVGEFFLARYRLNRELTDRAFAIRIANYLKSRAQADSGGLKWIQAENRIEPDSVQAQNRLDAGGRRHRFVFHPSRRIRWKRRNGESVSRFAVVVKP